MSNCCSSGEEKGIVVWGVSAAVLFFGNGYAPSWFISALVHWLWVLGFTPAICKNAVLKGRSPSVLDSEVLLTVQPNLRHTCRPAGALGDWGAGFLYTYRPAGALLLCQLRLAHVLTR